MKVLLCQAIQRVQIQPSEWRYPCVKSSKEYKYNLRNEGTLVSSHPKSTNTTFGMKVPLCQVIQRVQIQPSEWRYSCVKPSKEYKYNLRNEGTLVSSHPKSTNTTFGMKVLLCQAIQRVQIQPSEWRYSCVKPSKEYKYNLRNEGTLVSSQIQPSEWRYPCVKPSKEYKYNLRNEGTLVSSHPKSTNTTSGMKDTLVSSHPKSTNTTFGMKIGTTFGMKVPLCQAIQRVQIQPSEWRYSCVKPSKENKYNLRNEGTLVSSHPKSVKYGINSITHLAPKVWDIVPNEILKH